MPSPVFLIRISRNLLAMNWVVARFTLSQNHFFCALDKPVFNAGKRQNDISVFATPFFFHILLSYNTYQNLLYDQNV